MAFLAGVVGRAFGFFVGVFAFGFFVGVFITESFCMPGLGLMPGTGLATPPVSFASFLFSTYAICFAHLGFPSTLGSAQRHVGPPVTGSFPAVTLHRRCSLCSPQTMPHSDTFLPNLVLALIGVRFFVFAAVALPEGTAAVGVPGCSSMDAAMPAQCPEICPELTFPRFE